MEAAQRFKLTEDLAALVANPLTVELGIDISRDKWHLYQLEDGRIAVSWFDELGEQHDEELFTSAYAAARRFLEVTSP